MHEIRPARETDIPGLLRLLTQVNLVHHFGRPDLFRGPATKYSQQELETMLRTPGDTAIFVAEDPQGEVAGHAFCILKETAGDSILKDMKTLYIDDICVDESCRGKGVGRALYQYVRSYARSLGCYNLTLNVWACNPAALRFYESCGMQTQKIGMETIL